MSADRGSNPGGPSRRGLLKAGLAPPLLDTDPGSLACSVTGPGVIPPPGSVSPPPP